MLKFMQKLFQTDTHQACPSDDFIWHLAEALLWRDEEVSIGAIPSPIKDQPDKYRYYEDAKYLIEFVNDKIKETK